MPKFTVLIANDTIPQIAHELLREECEIRVCKALTKVILMNIQGVDALFWSSHEKLSKEIMDKAGPQMKVIATMSAGYDHIDVEEIKKRGIKFGNTPGVLTDAVADMAILLCLAAGRRYLEGREAIEKSLWTHDNGSQWLLGKDMKGTTVGIIGFGGIGQNIASRLKGFKVAKILYSGHSEKPEGKKLGAEFVPRDTLLKESDFVFVCVPLNEETEKMCDASFFSKMKETSIFVNVSRGGVVKQPDLIAALKAKKIFAAGLDVMTPEPLPPSHELFQLPNCFITPHLASATVQTRNDMAKLAAQNILKALKGEPMITPVS